MSHVAGVWRRVWARGSGWWGRVLGGSSVWGEEAGLGKWGPFLEDCTCCSDNTPPPIPPCPRDHCSAVLTYSLHPSEHLADSPHPARALLWLLTTSCWLLG